LSLQKAEEILESDRRTMSRNLDKEFHEWIESCHNSFDTEHAFDGMIPVPENVARNNKVFW